MKYKPRKPLRKEDRILDKLKFEDEANLHVQGI